MGIFSGGLLLLLLLSLLLWCCCCWSQRRIAAERFRSARAGPSQASSRPPASSTMVLAIVPRALNTSTVHSLRYTLRYYGTHGMCGTVRCGAASECHWAEWFALPPRRREWGKGRSRPIKTRAPINMRT